MTETVTAQEKYTRCYQLPNYRMGSGRLDRVRLDIAAIPRDAVYLDVACGRGETIDMAREAGIDAVGLDLVPDLCDGRRVIQGSILDLPFEDNAFDYVSCYDAVEHLPPEHVALALDQLFRVVAKVLVVTTNNQRSHLGDLELHLTRREREWWDEHLTSRAQAISPGATIARSTYGRFDHEWHWRIEL